MPQYKKISNSISRLTLSGAGGKKIRWFNIANPGKEELNFLRKMKIYDFDFEELRASSARSVAQRPLIKERKKYFFLILQFPVFKNGSIVAAEVDFFIGHGLLITLHNNSLSALNNFFNTCRKDDRNLLISQYPSSAILLHELISRLILHCYELMDQNNDKISKIEEIIFSGEQKKAVFKILELKHNVIDIRRIILNHKNILKKIMLMKSKVISGAKLREYYSELIEQMKRIWELSESQKEAIGIMDETNESLLNYRTNKIIKLLTVVSVILAPLSFIVALLTMNVRGGMPFLSDPNGFWLVNAGLGFLAAMIVIFFIKKKWL